ncbi:hypothetical protein EDD86DRAFT_187584 [Gorgonomyces haynaldii]|nr:hypothetical protein EDD86DRAFT_187584 [Gorgonomyces haynaldii]
MTSSRLIVKNLPKHVKEDRLRKHFESRGIPLTDLKMAKTADGQSRRFCYLGFKTEEQAGEIKKYFDNTFMDTSRISVEYAQSFASENIPRAWSKYSKGSSRYEHQQKKQTEQKQTAEEKQPEQETQDPQLDEFLSVLKPNPKIWSNDDTTVVKVKKTQDDDLYEELPEDTIEIQQQDSAAFDSNLSDMEYLRRKMTMKEEKEEMYVHPSRLQLLQEDGQVGEIVNKFQQSKEVEVVEAEYIEEPQDPIEIIQDTGRLLVKNLAYTCTMQDLEELFTPFGQIVEVHIPISRETKQSRGYGFVLFVIPENAVRAFVQLNNSIFQGRILEISPAQEKPKPVEVTGPSSFKTKREQQRKTQAQSDFNWNALFMNQDAVASSIAQKLGVSKQDVLDPSQENVAVKLALAETHIVNETKDYFSNHGVDLSTFSKKSKKGDTVILVKNLAFGVVESDLKQLFEGFGDLGRILMPPAKTIALVEMLHAAEAKIAFKKLAYSKFKSLPLFLEWAPQGCFTESYDPSKHQFVSEEPKSVKIVDKPDLEADEPTQSVFVKNLAFETTEQTLNQTFAGLGIRSSRIVKKKDPKTGQMRSQGFGFLEFKSKEDAQKCIKTMQHHILDGHQLELKFSNSQPTKTKKRTIEESEKSTKLMVRNIPFEASKKELKELFSSFGKLKTVRLPTKFNGQHRGFCFVDFATITEAEQAMDQLSATHLYGRHLVIEYAKEEESIDDLRKKAEKSFVREDKRQRVEMEDNEDDF